jgi:hypothetical protein
MALTKYRRKRLLSLRVELEALLEKLGYSVVSGKGSFKEGTCLIEKEKKVVINDYTPPDLQVDFLVDVISQMDLSNVYVLPAIRELVDDKQSLF